MRVSLKEERELAEAMHLLMPLHFFYERDRRPMPAIQFVDPSGMPPGERGLLVHDRDMTSTLAGYHHTPIDLQVVRREGTPDYLLRLVVLTRRELPVPVEFGAIGIRLEILPSALREDIEAGRKPLGALLAEHSLPYVSRPRAYFKVPADAFIADLLAEPEGTVLWGRCNALSLPDGEVFADIVEILPPSEKPAGGPVLSTDGSPAVC
jgi:chorismate-pyruvate lyase